MIATGLKNKFFNGFGSKTPSSKILLVELDKLGPTNITLLRSGNRKTLAIHVKDGKVEARAPLRLSEGQIVSFLQKKTNWIFKKLNSQNKIPPFQAKTFKSDEIYQILGKDYKLVVLGAGQKDVFVRGREIHLFLGNKTLIREPQIRAGRQLKAWYLEFAKNHIHKRVEMYSNEMNEPFKSIKIRNFKSQWGSCSIHADLTFNWRLIFSPPEVIDYVVVHELSHIRHHNHSPEYWEHLGHVMPDYKTHKKWLKENGHTLRWD